MRSVFILSILAILVVAQPPIPNRYPGKLVVEFRLIGRTF